MGDSFFQGGGVLLACFGQNDDGQNVACFVSGGGGVDDLLVLFGPKGQTFFGEASRSPCFSLQSVNDLGSDALLVFF